MRPSVQPAEIPRPNLEYGRVVSRSGPACYGVESQFGMHVAARAFSCLVQPEAGDRVLLSMDSAGDCYILSVLEREMETGETELAIPGDVSLHAEQGSLRLSADRALFLSGCDSIDAATNRMTVQAHEGEAAIGKLTLLGRRLHTQIKRITSVAKSVDHSFKRLTQRMKNCERFVEDHEEVQTGSTRYLVQDTLTTHAGNTLNISEELHTMQAEQIHMG
jgi:hypothetical protein